MKKILINLTALIAFSFAIAAQSSPNGSSVTTTKEVIDCVSISEVVAKCSYSTYWSDGSTVISSWTEKEIEITPLELYKTPWKKLIEKYFR